MYVSDPPEIEVERGWVHSGEGYEAQLVCIVHAEPPAEVSYSRVIIRKYTLYKVLLGDFPKYLYPRFVKNEKG